MEQTIIKIGQSPPSMQTVPVAVSILNVYIFLKKVIQRSVRLIWSAEKVKCKANRDNNSAKLTKYASCTSSR